jgi:hypothetical protein
MNGSPTGVSRAHLFAVAFMSGLVLISCGGSDENADLRKEVEVLQTQVATSPTQAGASAQPSTQPPTTSAPPALPDSIRISKIGVDAPLSLQKVSPEGSMPNPPDTHVGIYDFSGVAQSSGGPNAYGGMPGSGNTVVAAKHSAPGGPLLFFRLTSLTSDDSVEITFGGQSYSYRIVIVCTAASGDFTSIVRRTSRDVLTLITDSQQGPGFRTFAVAEREQGSLQPRCPAGNPI